MAVRDDGFVWEGERYRVRHWYPTDLLWILLVLAVAVVVLVAAALAYGARDDTSTTIETGAPPAVTVVGRGAVVSDGAGPIGQAAGPIGPADGPAFPPAPVITSYAPVAAQAATPFRPAHALADRPLHRVSPMARSARVPAIVVAVSLLPTLAVFGVMVAGFLSIGREGFDVTSTDSVVLVPSATTALVPVTLLLLASVPLLQMWWLHRAYRSLPVSRRHVHTWWALTPGACALLVVALDAVLAGPTHDSVDNVAVVWLVVAGIVAIYYLYCAGMRRIGSMYDVLGEHHCGTRLPGQIIRGFGTWGLLLLPWWGVLVLLDRGDPPELLRIVVQVVFLTWVIGLVAWYLACAGAMVVAIALVTPAQERAMVEQAAELTRARIGREATALSTGAALAGAAPVRTGPASAAHPAPADGAAPPGIAAPTGLGAEPPSG